MSDQASPKSYSINRSFFTDLDKLPLVAYSVVLGLIAFAGFVPLIALLFQLCRCDNGFVYRRLLDICCFTFPNLFSKVNVFENNGLKIEIREGILFLRTPVKSKIMLHFLIFTFGSLGLTVWMLAGIAFFRYTPITVGSECSTTSSLFGYVTQFCYCNSSDHSDDRPVDCKDYEKEPQICWNNASNSTNDTIEPDLSLTCYALSLEIGKSAAVALGILKISATSIFIIISIVNCIDKASRTKIENSDVGNERRWKYIKKYSITSFSSFCTLVFISLGAAISYFTFTGSSGIGEKMYNSSIALLCIYLGIYFSAIVLMFYAVWLEKRKNHDQYLMTASNGESGTLYDAETDIQVGINHQHDRSGANLVVSEQTPLLISNTETAET